MLSVSYTHLILGVEEKLTVLHNKFAFLGAIGVLTAIQKMLHLFGEMCIRDRKRPWGWNTP